MTQHLMLAVVALLLASLAGCGADGAPTRPDDTPPPGLHVSGEAQIGVVSAL